MDDYGLDRTELAGTLLSLEFDAGGRIHQLWAADPNLPDEGQEFQFVLTPVSFGEEFAEDYYPGTILLGARTGSDDPWILDRNKVATARDEDDADRTISFEYEFPLLSELRVTGKYYEIPGRLPQIAWDVRVANRGRVGIEVGEVAFPMALNNLFEGQPDLQGRENSLLDDRVRLHPFIGRAGSYLYANRMNGQAPGLVIFPGDETTWELCASVPASLLTPYRWSGIPILYALSRAAVEREGWEDRVGEGSALILEPGDSKVFQTRFVPTLADTGDAAQQALMACGRPAFRLLPSAVAPHTVGIAVEMSGAIPRSFWVSKPAEIETDADEDGGFCFVRPKEAGNLSLLVQDNQGRQEELHLSFTEPIETLIARRAAWIVEHQFHEDPGSALHHAILPFDLERGGRIDEPDAFGYPAMVESGLADALFLAEKNVAYPDAGQIAILDAVLDDFVRDDLQNPGDGAIGASFADLRSVAVHYGRSQTYALAASLHHAVARVAQRTGCTAREPSEYLEDATRTVVAMFRHAMGPTVRPGVRGVSLLEGLLEDLKAAGMEQQHEVVEGLLNERARLVLRLAQGLPHEWVWNATGFEEIAWAARRQSDPDWLEKIVRLAFSARSGAPAWWRYGNDPLVPFEPDGSIPPGFADRAEVLLGHTSVANSLVFFESLDKDYDHLPEHLMRLAFGGLLGSWALVLPDGSASHGFCPDPGSRQFGPLPFTGDLGLSLTLYLRGVRSWVLPSKAFGVFTFGCHFETTPEGFEVRPWDGVGRRISMRQIGFEVETDFGSITRLHLDARKRCARLEIQNPWRSDAIANLRLRGLWGRKAEMSGRLLQTVEGEVFARVSLPKAGHAKFDIEAVT